MRYIYTILSYLAIPVILIRLLLKSRHNKAYRDRWHERLGYVVPIEQKSIWLHAVSLGESIAALPLIEEILHQYPNLPCVVTTTTPTGSSIIQQRFGQKVHHYYAPYDIPRVINRFLKRINPVQAIIMETELWPNWLHRLKQEKIPTMIANARLSECAMRNYLRVHHAWQPLLKDLLIVAQSKADAKRFQSIGANKNNIHITGNIKFDCPIQDELITKSKTLRQHWKHRPTFIAASTHKGEEEIILDAFTKIRQKFTTALLILVPRNSERFATVAALCKQQKFTVTKRSANVLPDNETNIYLGDTIGELTLLYATSDVAFVGGSLVPVGGHNLIEPASLGLPILTGPNLQNFTAISDLLTEAKALLITPDANTIAAQVNNLFNQELLCHQLGARALSISEQNRGAIRRHMDLLAQQL